MPVHLYFNHYPTNTTLYALIPHLHDFVRSLFAGDEGAGRPRVPRHNQREPRVLEERTGQRYPRDPEHLRREAGQHARGARDLL